MASSDTQKKYYDKQSSSRKFGVSDHVWLSVPVAGKLDPKWEGGWKVTSDCCNFRWQKKQGGSH